MGSDVLTSPRAGKTILRWRGFRSGGFRLPHLLKDQGRRKHGNEIPWGCSGRSSGELSGPFCLEPHIFMCGALKLSGIFRANVRLNISIPMPLKRGHH